MPATRRPFRFMLTLPTAKAGTPEWSDDLRRIEDAGVDTVVMADHFTGGWVFEPLVTLAAASQRCERLRFQTNVLGNDYRHPVQVHRMAAAIDVLSAGRFELGIGAGWMRSDYDAAGLSFDEPRERVDRLEESLAVIKGLFRAEPFSFDGKHYTIRELVGAPPPVQRPHPPIFVGGGNKRVLSIAAREADIVGVHASLRAGTISTDVVKEMTPERVEEKLAWVRAAAERAGRSLADLELHMNFRFCAITRTPEEASERAAEYAARWGVGLAGIAGSPQVLFGTPEQCAEGLLARRERFGLSYFHFDPVPDSRVDLDAVRTVIRRVRDAAGE